MKLMPVLESRLARRITCKDVGEECSPLLHHLKRSTKNGSSKVRFSIPEAAAEAGKPAAPEGGVRDQGTLVLFIGNDLGDLGLNVGGILGLAAHAGKSINSVFNATLLDIVTRRVRKEEQATTKDESPGELQSNRNTIGSGRVKVLSSVDNAGGEQQTNGNTELVTGDERTADLARADFRHVKNDDSRLEANTETSNETAGDDSSESITSTSDHLNNHTDAVDDAAHDDSPFSPNAISQVTGNQSTEECTAG